MLDPHGGKTVVVTFDDAYLSVLELARPILDRLGLPATVFVPTDWPARDEPMRWPGIDQWMGGAVRARAAAADLGAARASSTRTDGRSAPTPGPTRT